MGGLYGSGWSGMSGVLGRESLESGMLGRESLQSGMLGRESLQSGMLGMVESGER